MKRVLNLLFIVLACLLFTSKVYAETCEYSFPMFKDCLANAADKSDTNFYISFDIGSNGLNGGAKITYGKNRASVYNGSFWDGSNNALQIKVSQDAVDVKVVCAVAKIKLRVKSSDLEKAAKSSGKYACPSAGWFSSYVANAVGATSEYSYADYYIWFSLNNSEAASTSVRQTQGGNPDDYTVTEECTARNEVIQSSDNQAKTCLKIQYFKKGSNYVPDVNQYSSPKCEGSLTPATVTNTGKNYQVIAKKSIIGIAGTPEEYTFTTTLPYVKSCKEADDATFTTTDTPPGSDPTNPPGDGTTPDTPGIDITPESMTCKQIVGENGVKLIKFGITTIRIAGAIIAIVVGMMNFIPAVAKKDNDELQRAAKKSIYMAIILVLILILPTIIGVIAKMFDFDVTCFL